MTQAPPATDSHLGQTWTTAGALTTTASTPVVSNIVLASNGSSSTANYFETGVVSICGVIYDDTTGNGFSADDTEFPKATVDLFAAPKRSMGPTGPPIATTFSAADGSYSFTNLAPGTYYVEEVVPTGCVQTGPTTMTY